MPGPQVFDFSTSDINFDKPKPSKSTPSSRRSMVALMPNPHRCLPMRSPMVRALVLTFSILAIGALLFRSNADVQTAIIKTATSAKQAIYLQRPLKHGGDWQDTLPTPTEPHRASSTGDDGSATALFTNSSLVAMDCNYDIARLKKWKERYNLQDKIEYTKRYIQVSRQPIRRKSMTNLNQSFLTDAIRTVDLNNPEPYQSEVCPEPLVAPVSMSPFPGSANASEFMFGVSTTYKRFSDAKTSPVNEWTYWLTDGRGNSNGGKLILMLLDAGEEELRDADEVLKGKGIDVDVYRSNPVEIMAVRYLGLVPTMFNHPERQGRKWLVTCDDDTFFPSFNGLKKRFEEFDHEFPMYIGTFSEDVNNIQRHGSQAFGGAGVFLSVPMAGLVTEKYESCKTDQKIKESNSGWGPQGDILLRKCIYENSNYKLTLLNELWQLDLHGDPSGFYESGIKPLSLHHYRGGGWHVAHPWHYTKVSNVCGEDCMMQRFRTEDDFVISNGFSVAYYSHGIDFDVNQFEATFHAAPQNHGWNLDFVMGPQRPSLHKTGRKLSWDLQEAEVEVDEEDGGAIVSVRQVYVRRADDWRWRNGDGSAMAGRDGVVEVVWLADRGGQ
ncbi:glycosyltransferase family 31 protein [Apiosordaria backusii]|uniref:Glycosyltransferase family 31 protein n=1 Tax=Apiosordaria backusii TaxID=314023 RepID=A0AA40A789_9PEZI|nr:glycosyltransferase family 31 protein [Apiosordaria backusii]